MRQAAILALLVGLWAAGAPTASAQLPDAELPDVEDTTEQLPDAPQVPLPDPNPLPTRGPPSLPGGDGGSGSGGGDSGSVGTTPSLGGTSGGTSSGGTSSGGSGSGSDGSGSGSGGGGGSGSGGSSGSGGGGSDSDDVCPCASPATGNPVAGDYDKCPLDRDGAGDTGSGRDAATLAADRESREEGGVSAGGVLGDGESDSEPNGEATPATAGDDDGLAGTGLLPLAILVLGLGLLTVGLAVGAGRLVGTRRDGPR